jgi:predicted lipoprotein with Yx(FWY)xxD motif
MRRAGRSLFLICSVFVLGAGLAWAQSSDTIQVRTSPTGVHFLTDQYGMTLYYFTLDADGKSACTGGCLQKWPVFYTDTIKVSAPLSAADFGTITRADGAKESTYKGWPLYYWYQDSAPGDMKGEGVGKVWFIVEVPAYTVMLATNSKLGNYLTDGNGDTLYWFTKDSPGESACTGNCLKAWPPFLVSSVVVPSALNPADFTTITRPDGSKQLAYKGYPLYYWQNDKMRGEVTGQGVGNVWYVINPEKFPAKMPG